MQSDEETWRNRGERRAKSRLKGVAPGIAFFFCKRRSSGSVSSIERRKLIYLFILDIQFSLFILHFVFEQEPQSY